MLRKLFLFFLILVTCYLLPKPAFAEAPYTITSFGSNIRLEQDTSLLVQETVKVNFTYPRHGIFRTIPVSYSARGRTINTDLNIVSVTDEKQVSYQFEASRLSQGVQIKIGDPDLTIVGLHAYVITYKINKVLQRFEDYDEIYWNVTGSEWDAQIKAATATIESPYAAIDKVTCFAGVVKDVETNCEVRYTDKEAKFNSTVALGSGKDFTVVVGLNKNSSLIFPTKAQVIGQTVRDNWGYLPAIFPFLFMVGFWYFRGRDRKYAEGTIYYDPENKQSKSVSLFERHHLPLVYSPIKGLTPAQIGVIIDEKVDIQDVISEIVELARLGYIKIKSTGGKEYSFTKLGSDDKGVLRSYQRYLLTELFPNGDHTKLSELKNKFYTKLEAFKSRLYDDLKILGYFYTRPDQTRTWWLVGGVLLLIAAGAIVFIFGTMSFNFYPVGVLVLLIFPTLLITNYMPRKTPKGYNLFQQIRGLRYYVDKGKWREEIAEKNLFIEEILPIAVALGVVKKLAKDMDQLGLKPPSYFGGTTGAFYTNFNGFYKSGSSSLASVPGSSGRSTWGGGSGFSSGGGFSGGGFGGGGGGSW